MNALTQQWWSHSLLVSLCIGATFGVLLSPFLMRAISIMSMTMSNSEILLVSGAVMTLFLSSFIAVRLTTYSMMALVAQIGQGTAFALTTPYAVDAVLSCVLIGVIVMSAVLLVRRRQKLTDAHLMTSALGIGIITFSLNMVGHGFMLDLATTVTLLFITLLGSVASAWLANCAAQWIRPTALGQWITKETAL
jgi:hypothetical protein